MWRERPNIGGLLLCAAWPDTKGTVGAKEMTLTTVAPLASPLPVPPPNQDVDPGPDPPEDEPARGCGAEAFKGEWSNEGWCP